MPICIPEEPEFRTRSERKVWHALYDGLSADAWLFSNFVFSDDRRDFEIDMLVVDPGVGIVVIEVKGGQLTRDPSGQWLQRGLVFAPRRVDPARTPHAAVLYALRW